MLDFNGASKTTQGNIGLGLAIAYFTIKRQTVCVPLNDNQSYDLVVDFDGVLKRVQVKTTGFKRDGVSYTVGIKATRHNMKSSRQVLFDASSCDYLFIITEAEDHYLIPAAEITVAHEIKLSTKYDKYRVT